MYRRFKARSKDTLRRRVASERAATEEALQTRLRSGRTSRRSSLGRDLTDTLIVNADGRMVPRAPPPGTIISVYHPSSSSLLSNNKGHYSPQLGATSSSLTTTLSPPGHQLPSSATGSPSASNPSTPPQANRSTASSGSTAGKGER
jgi:hypothetical protein